MTEYVGRTMLLLLLLERGNHRKLWEDLQVDCGWLIKGCMKLSVKHRCLLMLCTQRGFWSPCSQKSHLDVMLIQGEQQLWHSANE